MRNVDLNGACSLFNCGLRERGDVDRYLKSVLQVPMDTELKGFGFAFSFGRTLPGFKLGKLYSFNHTASQASTYHNP